MRLLLTEFRGKAFIQKLIAPDAKVEPVDVGDSGAWLEQPHVLMYRDRNGRFRENTARLAGKTLLWQQGDVTLRLRRPLEGESPADRPFGSLSSLVPLASGVKSL